MKKEAEYEKMCCYCEFSAPTYETEKMTCSKYGVVYSTYKCRKFLYDPLKRVPRALPKHNDYEPVSIDEE